MAGWWLIFFALVTMIVITTFFVWFPIQTAVRSARFADARRDFHFQREWLEVRFLEAAESRRKPVAPEWSEVDFDDGVSYVRNRTSGELAAFVGVTITIQDACEDDGEPHDAVYPSFRSGTAVFRFNGRRWSTDGVALLNLNPVEAVRFYRAELEMVAQEIAR